MNWQKYKDMEEFSTITNYYIALGTYVVLIALAYVFVRYTKAVLFNK